MVYFVSGYVEGSTIHKDILEEYLEDLIDLKFEKAIKANMKKYGNDSI